MDKKPEASKTICRRHLYLYVYKDGKIGNLEQAL